MKPVTLASDAMRWKLAKRELNCQVSRHGIRPLVMGILNVTPDSFSDGGQHDSVNDAVAVALRMQDDGADIVDIGGESTRPYSDPVSTDEELRRVIPVIEKLQSHLHIPISIDTSKATVARAALNAGAEIINDVTGLEGDPEMIEVAAESRAGVCVMHMQGTPQTMQDNPCYANVVSDIAEYLEQRWEWCVAQGIESASICLDPGIGFGKTHEHNLELIRHVKRFVALGRPILIGHSRKGFIGKILGDKTADRDAGTLGISLAMALAGAAVIRVHAVRDTVDALRLFSACQPLTADSP